MTCVTTTRRGARRALLATAVLALTAPAPALAMTLTEAVEAAVQHDPAVRASIAQAEAEREAGAQDIGSRLPQLQVSGSGAYQRTDSDGVFGTTSDSYTAWGAQIEARQALFRLDWTARGDRAEAYEALADEGLRERSQALLVRVASRFFTVLDAEDAVRQRRNEARAVEAAYEDAQDRYEVELIPRTDLVEAQSRHDLAQAQLLTAERALENALDALEETTGRRPEQLPRLGDTLQFPELEPESLSAWVEAAEARNPALAQARAEVSVTRADARSSKAARMPELDLVARAGIDDSSDFVFGQRVEDESIGVELVMPLYNGGTLAAREREAAARLRAAEAEVVRLEGETRRLVRERYRAVSSARTEVRAFARALESAQAAEQATRNGYEAGTRTITDVLDATSRVAQARRDLNSTRYQLLNSVLALKQSVGEIDRGDFRQIDALLRHSEPAAATDAPKDPS